MASDKDILAEAKEAYRIGLDAERDNRESYRDDYAFARLGQHWPEDQLKLRNRQGKPSLSIPKLPSFIRQVVNDARQNRPRIRVKPVDNFADVKTATVLDGLILNIETSSNAGIAYDTAIDSAVSGGFGYFRIDVEYAEGSFDKEIRINRIVNPLQVVGDPYSQCADSSDWNTGFITTLLPKDQFKRKYQGANPSSWFDVSYEQLKDPWRDGDEVLIAEYWSREEVDKTLLKLSDGRVMVEDVYVRQAEMLAQYGIFPGPETRKTKGYKVKQHLVTGAEVLESKDWAGCFIPIVPVYGEELNDGGRRIFRSLIHSAKDAQRRLNYWVSAATEHVALSPKTPFIGDERAFEAEPHKWNTVNTESHPYIAVPSGVQVPQRQPTDNGQAIGAISQALTASDDIKAILGMYDASLGARSNETSGKAIMARQREGDTATFHFIDNLSRAIQHAGRIIVELIPAVYQPGQMVRILHQDGRAATVELSNRAPVEEKPASEPFEDQERQREAGEMADTEEGIKYVYDFSVGRYDVVVDAGPSFTTKREETAQQLVELVRAYPQLAQVAGDKIIEALDVQGASEIAERLRRTMGPNITGNGLPPELQQQIDEGAQRLQQVEAENAQLKDKSQLDMAKLQADVENTKMQAELDRAKLQLEVQKIQFEAQKLQLEQYRAQTERMAAAAPQTLQVSEQLTPVLSQTVASTVAPMLAETLAKVAAEAAVAAISQMRVPVQRMRRIPVRGPDGLITEVIDEPVEDDDMESELVN
jgi:hypothetical protein